MRVYGLDFSVAKPLVCAVCSLERQELRLEGMEDIGDISAFSAFLNRGGSWIVGLDFPFGQPWRLVTDLGLPTQWPDYVEVVQGWGSADFKLRVDDYRATRQSGDKEHLRVTDALADSRSPMKFVNPPVAKMFFEGAGRLLDSGVCVLPCRETSERERVAVEVYPALVARRFAGRYKSDDPNKQTPEQQEARRDILRGLKDGGLRREFGFGVCVAGEDERRAIEDGTGDLLDSLLCAAQAAWAYLNRNRSYGVPTARHPVVRSEGWIVDPRLVAGRTPAVG